MISGGIFDVSNYDKKIAELEKERANPGFWLDSIKASKISKELNDLKEEKENFEKLKSNIEDDIELVDILDESEIKTIERNIKKYLKEINHLEEKTLLSGKYFTNDCLLEIHAGAGGTEACDWTSMLFRMYERWAEKEGFKFEIFDFLKGDEAGIKSVTCKIIGKYAYGYLKGETGVHRLVRISPFDSNKRRHTSFASVKVEPVIEEKIDIEILDKDLRIDIYHSSGAGGQSVNTTDSAVRITHLPTGIVVTCQNERSQIQNKAKAMEILKNKLYLIELAKREALKDANYEQEKNIEFGSQIRSYVLQPYSLVKDNRTNYSETDTSKVLDGEIDGFINSYLKMSKKTNE